MPGIQFSFWVATWLVAVMALAVLGGVVLAVWLAVHQLLDLLVVPPQPQKTTRYDRRVRPGGRRGAHKVGGQACHGASGLRLTVWAAT